MELFVLLSQAVLYICFALLLGTFILRIIPSELRPNVVVRQKVLVVVTALIPLAAFLPVLDITLYIAPRLGFTNALSIVLTTYTVGTAWDATLLIALVFVVLLIRTTATSKVASYVGIVLTTLLIVSVAWSSHAAALNATTGIVSDTLHLVGASVWVGILLVISFFAKDTNNWLAFLNWFTYTAVGCLAIIGISGFMLMDIMVDGYINAWMIDYGQGLLIKHLLLVPIFLFAFANTAVSRFFLLRDKPFQPLPWIRFEAILLSLIFIVTSAFSQQNPPHGAYLSEELVSPIFKWFHPDVTIGAGNVIGFVVNLQSVLFLFASLFAIIALAASFFFKKIPPIVSFIVSIIAVVCIYALLMVTTVIR